jgi:hypothetical protein
MNGSSSLDRITLFLRDVSGTHNVGSLGIAVEYLPERLAAGDSAETNFAVFHRFEPDDFRASLVSA